MRGLDRLAGFLGVKRSVGALLAMVVLIGLGERMAERFLPLYLEALGGGILAIGLLGGMNNLLGALYSLPGGWLSDRLGYKRALVAFNLLSVAGYLLVILVPHWISAIAGAMLFLSWSAISLPASMELVSSVLPKNKRAMGVSMHSLVRRIPMGLGPVLGGVLIDCYGERQGIRLAFGGAAVLALVSLLFQQMMIEDAPKGKDAPREGMLSAFRLIGPDLRRLLVSDILVRFCEQMPYAFVIIWCVSMNKASATEFGLLTAVEMATAMLIYVPVAHFADKGEKKPFVVATFAFFTLFPVALLFSHSFWAMLPAFVIRGLKEFGEPTRKALIMDLAPEGRKAAVFGAYYLVRDSIVSLAAFGGAWLWSLSPQANLVAAAAFGLFGTLYMAFFGKGTESPAKA